MQTSFTKRDSERRRLHEPIEAVIANVDGSFHVGCVTIDISESGARLAVREPVQVPDQFILLLSKDAHVQRQCEVVWRDGNMLGVRFNKTPTDGKRSQGALDR